MLKKFPYKQHIMYTLFRPLLVLFSLNKASDEREWEGVAGPSFLGKKRGIAIPPLIGTCCEL
jgi:hypothetical protein